MVFRFLSAIVLVVAVSGAGVALEKRNLDLRRRTTRQHYQLDALREAHARERLRAQELGAPTKLVDALESGKLKLERPTQTARSKRRRMPLLWWRRSIPPRR